MILTSEQLRQNAAAFLAFADGKPVQASYRRISGDNDPWCDVTCPDWDFEDYNYRPKPEPKTRRWSKPGDVPLNCWIRRKSQPELHCYITCIWPNGVAWNDSSGVRNLWFGQEQMDNWEHSTDRKTWHPCTVEEAP